MKMPQAENRIHTISVVVPIYNAERFLRRCLDSIISQDMSDFEVLLVDDGSNDTSGNICKAYVSKDDRFRYLYQDNAGPDMARKTGTLQSTGEYIIYIDADDYVAGNMFSTMLNYAIDSEADIVCSQIIRFNEKKQWDGSNSPKDTIVVEDADDIYRAYFDEETLIGTYYAKLIKSEIMRNYQFVEDGLIGEDITAALYMFDNARKVVVIPDKLYYYYQNMKSISHSKYTLRHARSLENYINVRDELFDKAYVSRSRVAGYFAGYEMAVATAMSRNGEYVTDTGEVLRLDLKSHWKYIRQDAKTPLYMRICILLYMISPKLFIFLYGIVYKTTGR